MKIKISFLKKFISQRKHGKECRDIWLRFINRQTEERRAIREDVSIIMNKESKKRLQVEFLKEPWHEVVTEWTVPWKVISMCSCGREECRDTNRTFTTWNDFGVCVRKLEENKEYGDFEERTFQKWSRWIEETGVQVATQADYHIWLHGLTPTGHMRLCELVAEWLKEKGE